MYLLYIFEHFEKMPISVAQIKLGTLHFLLPIPCNITSALRILLPLTELPPHFLVPQRKKNQQDQRK